MKIDKRILVSLEAMFVICSDEETEGLFNWGMRVAVRSIAVLLVFDKTACIKGNTIE